MAEVKRIPSGKWQAIVVLPIKLPSGRNKRLTKTHPLKRVVSEWATSMEAAIDAGTWLDPKSAQITLGEWRARWAESRIADNATSAKNESHWRNHIAPVWAGHPLALIGRGELKTWVARMHTETCAACRQRPGVNKNGVLVRHARPSGKPCQGSGEAPGLGAWTIQGAVAHLSGLLSAATDEGLLPANPAGGLTLPKPARKTVFWWRPDEAAQILLQLGDQDALMVDLWMHVGYRPGEIYGLHRKFVDDYTWQIHVAGVATRTGWRPWAKSSRSHRATPVPPHLHDRLWAHIAELGPDDLVFPAPGGGTWDDRNFARRIFDPAVRAAGVRRGHPYDMRHTAASWLVQKGVPLLDVQQLLGHEKYSTTLIYAHLAPGAFGSVLDAWAGAGIDPRAAPGSGGPSSPRPHRASETARRPAPDDAGTGL